MQFQQQLNDKQREIAGPLLQREQLAIAAVSATRNLSVVVDKRIVIYGGQDITKDVEAVFAGPQAIAPPAASPPPSEIGFVDQNALDGVPKVQSANSEMSQYETTQRQIYAARLAQAKSAARQATDSDGVQQADLRQAGPTAQAAGRPDEVRDRRTSPARRICSWSSIARTSFMEARTSLQMSRTSSPNSAGAFLGLAIGLCLAAASLSACGVNVHSAADPRSRLRSYRRSRQAPSALSAALAARRCHRRDNAQIVGPAGAAWRATDRGADPGAQPRAARRARSREQDLGRKATHVYGARTTGGRRRVDGRRHPGRRRACGRTDERRIRGFGSSRPPEPPMPTYRPTSRASSPKTTRRPAPSPTSCRRRRHKSIAPRPSSCSRTKPIYRCG